MMLIYLWVSELEQNFLEISDFPLGLGSQKVKAPLT
jgi:hypothetical protein